MPAVVRLDGRHDFRNLPGLSQQVSDDDHRDEDNERCDRGPRTRTRSLLQHGDAGGYERMHRPAICNIANQVLPLTTPIMGPAISEKVTFVIPVWS